MSEEVKLITTIFGTLILVSIIFIFILITLSNLSDMKTCDERWTPDGFQPKWGLWTGCMIKVDGIYIPPKNYIVNTK